MLLKLAAHLCEAQRLACLEPVASLERVWTQREEVALGQMRMYPARHGHGPERFSSAREPMEPLRGTHRSRSSRSSSGPFPEAMKSCANRLASPTTCSTRRYGRTKWRRALAKLGEPLPRKRAGSCRSTFRSWWRAVESANVLAYPDDASLLRATRTSLDAQQQRKTCAVAFLAFVRWSAELRSAGEGSNKGCWQPVTSAMRRSTFHRPDESGTGPRGGRPKKN